ncbi:hypothetical protein JTB14_028481 [Gonioctena quinquepunctata]|nr:hypothetical protein JTB14_028481 [Gonioctena quinquepunctata]
MEQYKRHRKVLRTAFSNIGNELEQLLTAERTDLQDIQVHWDLLEDKYGSLQDTNKDVFDSLLESDAPEEELGAEMESCDRYMKRFKLLKYKYEQLRGTTGINEERASTVSRPASNVSGTTEDLLRVWQRSTCFSNNDTNFGSPADTQPTTENRLKKLMCFLKSEVENEERISLAAEGFGLCSKENRSKRAKPRTLGSVSDQEKTESRRLAISEQGFGEGATAAGIPEELSSKAM